MVPLLAMVIMTGVLAWLLLTMLMCRPWCCCCGAWADGGWVLVTAAASRTKTQDGRLHFTTTFDAPARPAPNDSSRQQDRRQRGLQEERERVVELR